MMMAINAVQEEASTYDENSKLVADYFDMASNFLQQFCIKGCNPHFVGVWDTVSSVGWIENPVRLPYTSSNPDISIGRHAVAIDERRAFFRTNLWHPAPTGGGPIDVKQVWFPGVHCDVGGGYAEKESGLSKFALGWMLAEAQKAGLFTDPARVKLMMGGGGGDYVAPNPTAAAHDSLTAKWWAAEFVPKRHYDWVKGRERRRPNLFRRRTIPVGAMIHQSAYDRGEEYARRLPPNALRVSWEKPYKGD